MLLVHNAKAGPGNGQSAGDVGRELGSWGWEVTDLPCRGPRTPGDVARSLARGAFDAVLAAGGDGTAHLVANGLHLAGEAGRKVSLGVLPLGTANDFARGLGLPLDPAVALQALRQARPRPVDLGWVNGRAFLNVASVGLAAEVARGIDGAGKRRFGRLAYLVAAARHVVRGRTVPLHLELEGEAHQLEAWQVSVANGCCFGGGFRIAPDAAYDDGLLDVVVIEPGLEKLLKGATAPDQTLIGRLASATHRTRGLAIATRRPLTVDLDGEPVRLGAPLKFRVLPGAIRVLMPE